MKTIISIFFLSIYLHGSSQLRAWPFDKAAPPPDTLYYPFYNGVQMIEIDHIAYYAARDLEFAHMSQLPYDLHTRPIGNEYLFRNTSGTIIQCYNIHPDSASRIKKLRNIPFVNRDKHRKDRTEYYFALPYHHDYKFIFNHNIREYNYNDTNHTRHLKQGLIDTLGNLILPPKFNYLTIFSGHFIVGEKGFYGLITPQSGSVVPIKYPDYRTTPTFIYFTDNSGFKEAFHIPSRKVISLKNHPRPLDESRGLFLIQQNQQEGVIDILSNKILIPCQYGQLRLMSYNNDLVIKAYKDQKFGIFSLQGKLILPCMYDQIECCTREIFKVKLEGKNLEVKPK